MISLNSKAPDFNLMGSDGKKHSLADFSGRYLVLYFYPRDNTPGCTIEAKAFSSSLQELKKLNAEVAGVSDDSIESHDKFRSSCHLDLLLLSDPESKTIKAYDAYGDKGIFGMGTLRKTYIIDKKGIVVKIFPKVQPLGHEKEVLSFLKEVG